MVLPSDFLAVYPQFAVVESSVIQYSLNFAENNYCAGWADPKRTDGIMLIAAHRISIDWFQQADIASSVTGIASGQGSFTPSGSENDWSLTTYGRQYIHLRNTIFTPPILVL